MLILHQPANMFNQIRLANLLRVVCAHRLQDAAAVSEQVRHDPAIPDAGILGLNMEHPSVVLNVVVKTKKRRRQPIHERSLPTQFKNLAQASEV